MGLNNASFYQNMLDMELEHYLCEMFISPDLELPERIKILHTLVELTYFCASSVESVISHKIIDRLMTIMKTFQMEDQAEESFAYFGGVLVQNLTASNFHDFNMHIMETDFMRIYENLIEKSMRKPENLVYQRSIGMGGKYLKRSTPTIKRINCY